MMVQQHGLWRPYSPDSIPAGFPPKALFLRRESDGVDWYAFIRRAELQPDSVKMTVAEFNMRWIVLAANRDATMLFPQNCMLVEVEDYTEQVDPQDYFGQREFFPESNAYGERRPPPVITDIQFFQALALKGVITTNEALAAVRDGTLPLELERFAAAISDPTERFKARMYLQGSTIFERDHPVIQALVQFEGWSHEEADQIWRVGVTL